MPFTPTYHGFLRFTRAVGYPLAPFQKRIARACFEAEREVGACLPRGNAKSTLAALIALHHVLSTKDASVYVGAASRDQARIIGDVVRRYARHRAVAAHLTVRHDEIRLGDRRGPTCLRVVASDGARAYGWERPTLLIGDEVWAWSDRDPTLLGAMTTALVKNPRRGCCSSRRPRRCSTRRSAASASARCRPPRCAATASTSTRAAWGSDGLSGRSPTTWRPQAVHYARYAGGLLLLPCLPPGIGTRFA